jgi:hypothetical protein
MATAHKEDGGDVDHAVGHCFYPPKRLYVG